MAKTEAKEPKPKGPEYEPGEQPAVFEADVIESGLPAPIRDLVSSRKSFDLSSALEEFEYRQQMLEQVYPTAIKALKPKDFVVMGDPTDMDSPVYLQDVGSQRLKALLGPIVPERPKITRKELPDGEFAFVVEGWYGSRILRTGDYVIGGRASTDRFFNKYDDDGNRIPVDELDVRKSAYTNWENRAIAGLLGLRGLTVGDLKDAKFPIDKARSISFTKGGKGGAASGTAPARFGPEDARGKPWAELEDRHLQFYKKAAERSLADESKARYHDAERRRLDAINHEIAQREQGGEGE